MLKLNPKQARQPIGGHHFFDEKSGIMFRGQTFGEVEEKLKEFRVMNALPVGDPNQEILRFYLKHWPFMVKESGDEAPPDSSPYFLQLAFWVRMAWNSIKTLGITPKEASSRWETCEKCPFNLRVDWDKECKTDAEKKQMAEVNRRIFLLKRGAKTPSYLGFCALHGADISVLSFQQKPGTLSCKKAGEDHPACWVK